MNSHIRWLRISFIAGAIADALVGILILVPSEMGEVEFTYPMGLAAALMFGWTILLLWGFQKPYERKGLLLITIFPVITGLVTAGFYMVAAGKFTFLKILPSTILGVVLIILMGYSYYKAYFSS
ncbi:MAG TPA: hypothetical protein PK014_14205 [Thermoanaerobaculia bacterium]|nr:hypothetical protein [Thermoanaerobaculia bacterium]HUM31217.1 hypothetical protein [Thermoanaerobaculia bacterium]HXK69547.1 hypothetical protein [Thermoanaerobaculia bacterium]